jgi:hypothetical protein
MNSASPLETGKKRCVGMCDVCSREVEGAITSQAGTHNPPTRSAVLEVQPLVISHRDRVTPKVAATNGLGVGKISRGRNQAEMNGRKDDEPEI